ncbi:hypothetical protein SDC9_49622 [bioreactor metagenome]|uniref:DUF443 family protein n=1 Tax=bioreactor metagenome TaxID=1076179 RepID=A0A644WIG5_9ZZZZ
MEVSKNDVAKLIEIRTKSTFLHHLSNFFSHDMRSKGEIGRNKIKFWEQNMNGWAFYPVLIFDFNEDDRLIKISDRLNPFGKTIIGIILLGFLYLIFPKNISDYDFEKKWPIISLIAVFVLIAVFLARAAYRFEKKNQLEKIFELLNVKIENEKPEKEWSLKRILIRVILYPLCMFLIGLSIFVAIPEREYLLALGIFGFVGVYLFSDIKMILKSKKRQ